MIQGSGTMNGDGFTHLTNPNAGEWQGLRLPARQRLAAICGHVLKAGTLQRSDVMRLCEVSQPQASLDIRAILERAPGLIEYDKSAKCYTLAEAS